MSKNKVEITENQNETNKHNNWNGFGKGIIFLGLAGILGYGTWYYKSDIKNWLDNISAPKVEGTVVNPMETIQQQLTDLQNKLRDVEYTANNPDLSAIKKRVDDIEQISVNTIKSKADVEALLGLVVRMDNAEEKLRSLAKVTDDGALILTAAMLVKEAGERGSEFVYEAEVLSEVTKGNIKIKDEVKRIEEIASLGVPSKEELQKDFIEVYVTKYPQEIEEENHATNWKERIYNKLRKIIKIKKAGENEEETKPFSEEDRAWDIIRDFVISGNIIRAVGIAEKPLNHELLENEQFKLWLDNAKIYRDFYESISRITANGLAVMKVKFLKD